MSRSRTILRATFVVILLAAPVGATGGGEDLLAPLSGDVPYAPLAYVCQEDSYVRQTSEFYLAEDVKEETRERAYQLPCSEYQVKGVLAVRNGPEGDLHLRVVRPTALIGAAGKTYVMDPEARVREEIARAGVESLSQPLWVSDWHPDVLREDVVIHRVDLYMMIDGDIEAAASFRAVPLQATAQADTLLASIGSIPLTEAEDYVVRVFLSPASEASGQGVYTQAYTVRFEEMDPEQQPEPETGDHHDVNLTTFALVSYSDPERTDDGTFAGAWFQNGPCYYSNGGGSHPYWYFCPRKIRQTPDEIDLPTLNAGVNHARMEIGRWRDWDRRDYGEQQDILTRASHKSSYFWARGSDGEIVVALGSINASYTMTCDSKDPNEGDPQDYAQNNDGSPREPYQWFWYCAAAGTYGEVEVILSDVTAQSTDLIATVFRTNEVNIRGCAWGFCEWYNDNVRIEDETVEVRFEVAMTEGHIYRIDLVGEALTPEPDAGTLRFINEFEYNIQYIRACWPDCHPTT